MSKENLTAEQLKTTKHIDKTLKSLINLKEQLKDYKLGDIYILEEWYSGDSKNVFVQKNHFGFPVKYTVAYISPEGIPYLRKITSAGNPTGDIFVPSEADIVNILYKTTLSTVDRNMRFVPDPEQLDAILLQQEFDPMAQHRDKSKLYNEINKHNKRIQVPTGYYSNKIADFFKSKKSGDKFWTSPDKQYIIQSIVKQGREYVITCTDMNHATKTFNFSYFNYRRLYKEQPRSFAKESKV